VAAIFAFGAIVFCGLFFAPKAGPPAVPGEARWGVPERKLRFVTWDLRRRHPGAGNALDIVRQLQPDYVLLQGIEEEDVIPLAEVMGMQHSYHPQLYQRAKNFSGRKADWGAVVLSKYPLYEGRGIPGPEGVSGAWAVSVVDGRKFVVAAAHLAAGEQGQQEAAALREAWEKRQSPPMVLALLPADGNVSPKIQPIATGAETDGQWLLFTPGWSASAVAVPAPGDGPVPLAAEGSAAENSSIPAARETAR
jgi:endonuclease/exonuclease/phosphatase family metal-dependent hydrolase